MASRHMITSCAPSGEQYSVTAAIQLLVVLGRETFKDHADREAVLQVHSHQDVAREAKTLYNTGPMGDTQLRMDGEGKIHFCHGRGRLA